MDPNANIAEQDRITRAGTPPADRARLHELRAALRAWLHRGGFHPVGLTPSHYATTTRRTRDTQAGIPVGSRYRHHDAED